MNVIDNSFYRNRNNLVFITLRPTAVIEDKNVNDEPTT